MSDREVRYFGPAADNLQDWGLPNLRWKNGFFKNLSDGANSVTPAALADLLAFMSGKGGVTASLAIYIRADGNDANDGSSIAKAVATGARAIELANTRYFGAFGFLELNFGPGTFAGNWSPFGIAGYVRSLRIVGAGIDSTILANNSQWVNSGLTAKRFPILLVSDLTIKPESTFSPTSYLSAASAFLSLSNVHFDSSNIALLYYPILLNHDSRARVSGTLKFTGNFQFFIYLSLAFGGAVMFDADSRLVVSPGASFKQVFRANNGGTIYLGQVNTGYFPDYGDAAPEGFAQLQIGSRIVFASVACQNAWINGWNSSVSAGSEMIVG